MGLMSTIKSIFGFSSATPTLSKGDRMLQCEDCKKDFVFDAGEQRFFKEKGFTDPKRCPRCRKKVRFRIKKKGRNHNHQHQSNGHRRGHSSFRKNSVIDGDSPYADER